MPPAEAWAHWHPGGSRGLWPAILPGPRPRAPLPLPSLHRSSAMETVLPPSSLPLHQPTPRIPGPQSSLTWALSPAGLIRPVLTPSQPLVVALASGAQSPDPGPRAGTLRGPQNSPDVPVPTHSLLTLSSSCEGLRAPPRLGPLPSQAPSHPKPGVGPGGGSCPTACPHHTGHPSHCGQLGGGPQAFLGGTQGSLRWQVYLGGGDSWCRLWGLLHCLALPGHTPFWKGLRVP